MRLSLYVAVPAAIAIVGSPALAQETEAFIDGHVRLETGTPIPEGYRIAINVYLPDGQHVALAPGVDLVDWVDETGSYRVGPIPAGDYRIEFVDNSGFAFEGIGCPCLGADGSAELNVGWWPDAAGIDTAADVTLTDAQTTTLDWTVRQVGPIPTGDTTTTSTTPSVLPDTGSSVPAAAALVLLGIGTLMVISASPATPRSST